MSLRFSRLVSTASKGLEKQKIIINENNITTYVHEVAKRKAQPYFNKANEFSKAKLPTPPTKWEFQSGWYKYEPGKPPIKVPFPEEDAISFDGEVLYKISRYPTLATAVSSKAWYGWVSPYLVGEELKPTTLIPLNPENKDKVIIGHYNHFDRVMVKDDYEEMLFKNSKSCHIDIVGLHYFCNTKIGKKTPSTLDIIRGPLFYKNNSKSLMGKDNNRFHMLSKLYTNVTRKKLDKEIRDLFGNTGKEEVVKHFQNAMSYCAKDVEATHRVFSNLWKKCLPNPHFHKYLLGIKLLGNHKMIVNKSKWDDYNKLNDDKSRKLLEDINNRVLTIGKENGFANLTLDSPEIVSLLGIKFLGKYPLESYHLKNGTRNRNLTYTVELDDSILKDYPLVKSSSITLKSHDLFIRDCESHRKQYQTDYRDLWINGILTVKPEYQNIIDDYSNLTSWEFNKCHDAFLIHQNSQLKDLSIFLPWIIPSVFENSDPVAQASHKLILENFIDIGKGIEDQLVAPEGYKFISLRIDHDLIKSLIMKQENLQNVSPYIIRDGLKSCKVGYIHRLLIHIDNLFEKQGIKEYQLMSTFKDRFIILVKEDEQVKAENILKQVDELIKFEFGSNFNNEKKVIVMIQDEDVLHTKTISEFDMYKDLKSIDPEQRKLY
ncbi:DNA polymerase subunit gamma-1 [Wickerhamomyces ciferrii]|uniref:DNA polymerase subunit gamma-1 n=1 Tax=Wickerhamomyces ciferrii (strain ATCC 14091 / BCRC 22168 / CBS 111 / JCM 3599 / NBRC 0793 / NRRL Y-1031 F-60-10) TaxID=1206466 RepID=K0KHU8_WICCF|nr:DNA polymerase subunit gamma-1 [Wickerhamomyces ciferrii]CCH40733.1 DNA polymerase subunit gamma-1 [Wickerhamomyces ciferrii]